MRLPADGSPQYAVMFFRWQAAVARKRALFRPQRRERRLASSRQSNVPAARIPTIQPPIPGRYAVAQNNFRCSMSPNFST